jgi:predicted Mrr-cat superfamily restriction endonuclease
MHLSYGGEDRAELWDHAYRNNLIGLDYEGVDEDWLTIPESNRNKIVPTRDWYRQFKLFCEDMRVGDCVLVTAGMVPSYLLGVGLVDSPYFFDEKYREKFFGHVRYVRWILKYRYDDKVRINAYFRKTLLRIDSKCKLWNLINLNLKIPTNVERTILVTRKAKIVRHMPSKGEIQRAINKLRSKSNSDTTNIDREIKKTKLAKIGGTPQEVSTATNHKGRFKFCRHCC